MKFSHLATFRSPSTGKYRVMMVGQPEAHIMDWRGCNFRRMALPTAMKKTFNKATDALAYEKELEKTADEQLTKFARICGDGAWFDQREYVSSSEVEAMPDAPTKGWLKNQCTGECGRQWQVYEKNCQKCGAPVAKVLELDKNKVMG